MPFRMSTDNRLGVPDLQLYAVDTVPRVAPGTVIRAFDDAGIMGDGEFVYVYNSSGAKVAGAACVFITGPSPSLVDLAAATHANSGRPIAVCLTDIPAGSYGWAQITGCAVVLSTSAALGNKVYAGNANTLVNTQAAGVQILGAVFASGNGNPASGKAYVMLNRPTVQSQIT